MIKKVWKQYEAILDSRPKVPIVDRNVVKKKNERNTNKSKSSGISGKKRPLQTPNKLVIPPKA